jgi:hypothetical protein
MERIDRGHEHDYATYTCSCGEEVCHSCATGSRDNGVGGWELRCPTCNEWFDQY